jgi:glycosyltransferase involved in cell wall biosynthesis
MRLGICAFPSYRSRDTACGHDRVVEEILTYLDAQGVTFSFYERGRIRDELVAIGKSISYSLELLFRRDDCYFATYPVAGFFPAILRKHPLVLAVHDMIPFSVTAYDSKLKFAIKRICIRYSCIHADAILVPFQSTKNDIVHRFGVNPDIIRLVPYGVNHENFFLDHSIPKEEGRIAFLGEAKRAKGMDSAIRAFARVVERRPETRLVLASQGSELPEMKRLASRILPRDSYEFVGHVPEDRMREFYAKAKVFLFPSRYGFGLSPVEAMACGTPAIVGATLDAREFFHDPDLWADPDDPRELADKILALLADPAKYEDKRTAAVQLASEYSWNRTASAYYDAFLRSVG